MIQIIVTTHGKLAGELVDTTRIIVGSREQLAAVGLETNEGIEDLSRKLATVLEACNNPDEGSLILVDMFGGTPSNVTLALTQQYNIQVVTGVNLPMLIEAVTHRPFMKLFELADLVAEKAKQSILTANDLIKRN